MVEDGRVPSKEKRIDHKNKIKKYKNTPNKIRKNYIQERKIKLNKFEVINKRKIIHFKYNYFFSFTLLF